MGLGDALERLDRRVLRKHADPGVPPKRPVRFAVLWILGMGLFQSLGLLVIGFTPAEAAEAFLTYLAGVAIWAPLLVWFFRRRGKRGRSGGGEPEN